MDSKAINLSSFTLKKHQFYRIILNDDHFVLLIVKSRKYNYSMSSDATPITETDAQKVERIVNCNTFFNPNHSYEDEYESYLSKIVNLIIETRKKIREGEVLFVVYSHLLKEDSGLIAFLSITGISMEFLKRVTTYIRRTSDLKVRELTRSDYWPSSRNNTEYSETKLHEYLKTNETFRNGLLSFFIEGSKIDSIKEMLPLFELKKFDRSKLVFDEDEILDSLVRNKESGSSAAKPQNNAELKIQTLLNNLNISYEHGDLPKLALNERNSKRTMDFIIPNKQNPLVIVECSFLVTTSSGMGDKAKTEIKVGELIKQHYPGVKFIGFIDGVGWSARLADLKRMVSAFDDVYTFSQTELSRFEALLKGMKL